MRLSVFVERYPLVDTFIGVAVSPGILRNDDSNGNAKEGAVYRQVTTDRGLRGSTAKTRPKAARTRPNPRVETGARATRIALKGRRTVGLLSLQLGLKNTVSAARSLALAGAI